MMQSSIDPAVQLRRVQVPHRWHRKEQPVLLSVLTFQLRRCSTVLHLKPLLPGTAVVPVFNVHHSTEFSCGQRNNGLSADHGQNRCCADALDSTAASSETTLDNGTNTGFRPGACWPGPQPRVLLSGCRLFRFDINNLPEFEDVITGRGCPCAIKITMKRKRLFLLASCHNVCSGPEARPNTVGEICDSRRRVRLAGLKPVINK